MKKMNIFIVFIVFLLFIGLLPYVIAASWYVDNAVVPGGNGRSWASAWNNFSSINWSAIQPGDIIYISGGVNKKIYGEEVYQTPSKPRNYTFRINAQGLPNAPIIITKGVDIGHNGEVIFDAKNRSIGAAILINSAKHVIIENFTIVNYNSGFFLKSGTTNGINGIIIRNNIIDNVSGHGGVSFDGWSQSCNTGSCAYDTINNVVIKNNFIRTIESTPAQTDLIYVQYYQNLTIEKNTLVQRNIWDNGICDHSSNSTPHADAIQSFRGKDLTIRFNFIDYRIIRPCSNTFMLSENIGNTSIYGNIVLSYVPGNPGKGRQSIIEKISSSDPNFNTSETIRFYNNVIISDVYNALGIRHIYGDYEIKNNIFYSLRPKTDYSQSIVFLSNAPLDSSRINGNLYYGYTNNTVPELYWIPWGSKPRSFDQIRSLGFEINGIIGDPKFKDIDNYDLSLQANSSAIDAGISLEPSYALSYNGVLRPQGSGWDIGAFEFVSGQSSCSAGDSNCDGCISLSEVSVFVSLWLNGQVSLSDVSAVVSRWLGGC